MNLYKTDINKDQSLNDFNLDNTSATFQDSISSIQWINQLNNGISPNMFAVTTWDGTARIYEIVQSNIGYSITQKFFIKVGTPVLSCCWNGQNTKLYVGCGDNILRSIELETSKITNVGKHNNAIKDVFFIPNKNLILSTSYDKNINIWQDGNMNPIANVPLNNKLYTASFKYPLFAGGLSQQKLLFFDINNIGIKSYIDSPLGKNSQLQSIQLGNQCDIFGIGSIDGRCNLSKIQKLESGQYRNSSIMTFKSNKVEQHGKIYFYPVNTIGFNSRNKKWVLTGGADGYIHYWDYQAKNKIKQFSYGRTPVTTARVNSSGELLAYGLGNDWHMGVEGIGKWQPKLCVHFINENQMKYLKP